MPALPPPPVADDARTFLFAAADLQAGTGALERRFGGVVAGWDTRDPRKMMSPGMKVVFFGQPGAGCAAGARDGDAAPVPGAAGPSWTPDPATAACDPVARFSPRRPAVALAGSAAAPELELSTPTGPDASGRPGFFGPWGGQGQDGRGTNANIAGSFVIFRQAWNGPRPRHPWAGRADGPPVDARLRSTQSVRVARVGADPGAGQAVQVKQQVMASFINTTCMRTIGGPQHLCQLQYLLNTAVVRAGVADWSRVAWFAQGNVMFDPAQGGIPVVDGPIKAAGDETVDVRSGLGLFTSQGAATQHGEFAPLVFDARISFAQLQNALRIVAARADGVPASAVSARRMAETWGAAYADPSAWVLLSADVAQEAHNPLAGAREAVIEGAVRDLSVGPAE